VEKSCLLHLTLYDTLGQQMSKAVRMRVVSGTQRFGGWLRTFRDALGLPLHTVAEAADMDLAHLHKIEQVHRLPTEDQTRRLAELFKLDETETQARRIAEKFRQEFAATPAPKEAISILAEEAGAKSGKGAREH